MYTGASDGFVGKADCFVGKANSFQSSLYPLSTEQWLCFKEMTNSVDLAIKRFGPCLIINNNAESKLPGGFVDKSIDVIGREPPRHMLKETKGAKYWRPNQILHSDL